MINEITNETRSDGYITIGKFIKQLLENIPFAERNDDLESFSSVIYHMWTYKMYKCWSQLIELRLANIEINENNLRNILTTEINIRGEKSNDDFGIRITEAGRFLAYILSDFEYFAGRYVDEKKYKYPLFFYCNTNDYKDGLAIAEKVVDSALACIDDAIEYDKKCCNNSYRILHDSNRYYLYRNKDKDNRPFKGVVHPRRILDNFIGYLDIYRRYVIEINAIKPWCMNFSKDMINTISRLVDKLREIILIADKEDVYYLTGNTTKAKDTIFSKYLDNINFINDEHKKNNPNLKILLKSILG
jgi:hypothetical protein